MDYNSVICWTASHIYDEKRLSYLIRCIRNVNKFDNITHHYISVSFSTKELENKFNILRETLLKKITKTIIYISSVQLVQFNHLRVIYNFLNDELNDKTRILFLDDDDQLLKVCDGDAVYGSEMVKYNGSTKIFNDFPGCIVPFVFVKNYFTLMPSFNTHIEDVIFFRLLGRFFEVITPKEPTILRHIAKSHENEMSWKKDTMVIKSLENSDSLADEQSNYDNYCVAYNNFVNKMQSDGYDIKKDCTNDVPSLFKLRNGYMPTPPFKITF